MYGCKLGCKRVQTGINGCGWVPMGALGHVVSGEHKNQGKGDIYWSTWTGFGSYGRGNFPGHDVLWGFT